GALMALADTCGAVCAFLNLPAGARGTTTIESKTNLLRAVRDGAITATTRALHLGRTLIVLETELTREDGALVAKTIQTQAYQYARDCRADRPAPLARARGRWTATAVAAALSRSPARRARASRPATRRARRARRASAPTRLRDARGCGARARRVC